MSFFRSELVQKEIEEIAFLQERVYYNVFNFPRMTKEEKLEHLNSMKELLEKQRILYTRLSLSDAPEALEMKEKIMHSAYAIGIPIGMDINLLFNDISKVIDVMKNKLDNSQSI